MKKYFISLTLALAPLLAWIPQSAVVTVQASNTFNLTYELYGGTNHANNPTSYTDLDEDFSLLPASKTGLTFQGWYKSEGFREVDRVAALPGIHTGVTKLYAKWGPLSYTVDFVTNGGNAIDQQLSIPIYSLNGNASYNGSAQPSGGSGTFTSIARDINGDGKADFIGFENGDRHIYYSHPTLGFSYTKISNNLINFAWAAKFFDINHDNLEDLVVLAANGNMTYSLRQNDGSLGTETLLTLQSGGVSYGESIDFTMADIDGDDNLDMALAVAGQIVYRLNTGPFTFGPAINVTNVNNYGRGVLIHDLNQDGHLDIIGSSDYSAFVKWGDGVTPFGGNKVGTNLTAYRPFISDVDRDGDYEQIGLTQGLTIPVYISFVGTTGASGTNLMPGPGVWRIGSVSWVGDEMDANGDGYADLFYPGGRGNSGMLMSLGNGTYRTEEFSLIDDINSGTIVFDPAYGTLGVMGIGYFTNITRYYTVSGANQSVSHLANLAPTREGYQFEGWYESSDLTGSAFNFSLGVTSNKTLYAKWTPIGYNVNYVMNGGTNHPNNPAQVNIETPLTTLGTPTKTGSLFLGWYTTPNFEGEPVTTIPAAPTSSLSFYAKWLDPVTMSFNTAGGSSVSSITALPGTNVTQPPAPTRAGYTFLGWYANAALTTPYSFTTMPNSNVTIYAKWNALTFTITFETNGGSVMATIERNTDQSLALPPNPTKVGHTFEGWYTNAALTTRLTATKMTPYSITLYAKWVVNVHTLSWNVDGRMYFEEVTYGTAVQTILPTPTKYQFEFKGWTVDGETFIDVSSFTMPDNNVELVAVFEDNVMPVVFTIHDGDTYTSVVDIIFNEGTATLNGTPILSGYRVNAAGDYTLVITDGVNTRTITFTVVEPASDIRWYLFAGVLAVTWLFLALVYWFNRTPSSSGPEGGTMALAKAKPVLPIKPPTKKEPRFIKEPPSSKEPKTPQSKGEPKVMPSTQVAQSRPTPPPMVTPKVDVKPEPKGKPASVEKVPPMPVVAKEVVDQQLTETVIFKTPLKVRHDPVETYTPEQQKEFEEVFVANDRKVHVPELTYVPKTSNAPFYTNLFRYIFRFSSVISEALLTNLTQSVIKLTDDKEAQLKIVEASTRTAENLTTTHQDYLLKILRRNVALNRDVLNPRNKYVYAYQRLATLLEEKEIYLEAVILVREAFERGLLDTPETTFEKRLTRLEKKLIQTDGRRQDMIRK